MSQQLRMHIEHTVSLTDEEFEQVLLHFTEKHFRKHQFLVQEESYIEKDFYIISGLVKAYHTDEDGKEHIIQFAIEDSWITDTKALHEQSKASLNIYCIEHSHTLSITTVGMENLCEVLPKMETFFRKKAIYDTILLQRRILCLISNNATTRYNDLLLNYPQVIQRVPKTMIASYLGVSRETLSRLM
jgi:CRP-like cAMP-binding protein